MCSEELEIKLSFIYSSKVLNKIKNSDATKIIKNLVVDLPRTNLQDKKNVGNIYIEKICSVSK